LNRRSFFRFLGAGAATLALSEAIPFGRVWSFPSKIVVPKTGNRLLTCEEVSAMVARIYADKIDELMMHGSAVLRIDWDREFAKPRPVGQTITLKIPRQYSRRVADSSLFLPA
jgi:hypothetical protein